MRNATRNINITNGAGRRRRRRRRNRGNDDTFSLSALQLVKESILHGLSVLLVHLLSTNSHLLDKRTIAEEESFVNGLLVADIFSNDAARSRNGHSNYGRLVSARNLTEEFTLEASRGKESLAALGFSGRSFLRGL